MRILHGVTGAIRVLRMPPSFEKEGESARLFVYLFHLHRLNCCENIPDFFVEM